MPTAEMTGRVVVITGGANGMGEATAHTFARAGATVVIADIDTERSPLVEAEVRERGGDAHAIVTDVREPEQVADLIARVRARWGRVDVLHNNAASLELTAHDRTVLDTEPGLFLETLRGNLYSIFLTTRAVLPTMLEQGSGSIVNIASASALAGEVQLTSYGVSKAAVVQLTRATAVQYGKQGVRCNAIAPAVVKTRNVETYGTPQGEIIYRRAMATPDVAQPQDVADAVYFLGSDASRMITGQVLAVDGGLHASQPINADYRAWLTEGREPVA
ncbi:SDR family NAD(P)-dependent oxidoreductase [Nocardioides humi]|uniref:Glucose 1-dehydrogenase n=1 Tax=Nocardioides humi TaxID=449461 RepID=A0ABN2AH05_9ACTN|nr:SDR family oxidoreductase [Nocardioides humi]